MVDGPDLFEQAVAAANSQLHLEQRVAVRAILAGHNVVLTGQGGTGKTTTIRHCIQLMRLLFCRNPRAVLVLAASLVAAAGLDNEATTIHSAFSGMRLAKEDLETIVRNVCSNAAAMKLLRQVKAVFIDEGFRVSCKVGGAMDLCFRAAKGRPDLFFGGVQMIWCGDPLQTGPIDDKTEGGGDEEQQAASMAVEAMAGIYNDADAAAGAVAPGAVEETKQQAAPTPYPASSTFAASAFAQAVPLRVVHRVGACTGDSAKAFFLGLLARLRTGEATDEDRTWVNDSLKRAQQQNAALAAAADPPALFAPFLVLYEERKRKGITKSLSQMHKDAHPAVAKKGRALGVVSIARPAATSASSRAGAVGSIVPEPSAAATSVPGKFTMDFIGGDKRQRPPQAAAPPAAAELPAPAAVLFTTNKDVTAVSDAKSTCYLQSLRGVERGCVGASGCAFAMVARGRG